MKKLIFILLVFLIVCSLGACSNINSVNNKTTESTTESATQIQKNDITITSTTEKYNNMINIKIGNTSFTAKLYDNEIAKAFADMLPLTLDMNELNGNEKYYNLKNALPTNITDTDKINTGDIMLYGNNCIVLFYDSFSTSYSYTKIGYIVNPEGLAETVGSGNITITFNK